MTVLLQMPVSSTAAAAVAISSIHPRHHLSHEKLLISDNNIKMSARNIDGILKNNNIYGSNIRHSSTLSKRKRLHKRHSEYLYIQHHLEESSTDLEWFNPCNGFFEPSTEESSSNVPPASHFLRRLRGVLRREFQNINGTLKNINIGDMRPWSSYRNFYSFLPKIQLNSSIALKRWYRQMQIYVGTFAHLARMQYKFDRSKRMSSSELTHELNDLLLSARSILCEIETTINGSYPFPNNQRKLYSFTREEMNKRLQFLTTQRLNRHLRKDMLIEPEMLDLQFAKFKYIKFLRRMWRVIRMRTKHRGQKSLSMESTEISASILDASLSESLNEISSISNSKDTSAYSEESGSHAGHTKPRRRHRHTKKNQQKSVRK